MNHRAETVTSTWTRERCSVLAMARLADDLTPHGIARFGELDLAEAHDHFAAAEAAGLLDADEETWLRLIADLSPDQRLHVHSKAAAHLLAEGPTRLGDAVKHLTAAASSADPETAIELADHSGQVSASLGDYASAHTLLSLAADYDISPDLSRRGHRLCDLAAAADGLGRLEEARRHLTRAVALGELANDAALVARAAVAHALPVDWHAGNPHTIGLLQRASTLDLTPDDRVAVNAARAMAEMRIPIMAGEHAQVAWVTRPAVAQPLADQALVDSNACGPRARCLAALAWRSTHRAPQFLDCRRDLSVRTLELAQSLRVPQLQVEAATWLAVDALESGDRELFERGLSAAQWVARTDGNPRLLFRAQTLAIGAALLDDDRERARALLATTTRIVADLDRTLLQIVKTLFAGQMLLSEDDPEAMARVDFDLTAPLSVHPIGRVGMAYVLARTGRGELAGELARRTLRQWDSESSALLVGTRVAAVAHEVGDVALCRDVIEALTPFADHVAADSNGWWCDGPVSMWLAMVHVTLGNLQTARQLVADAQATARAMRDVRSLRRLEHLTAQLPATVATHQDAGTGLTEREHSVLRALAAGATNAQIAQQFAFSVSTIRNDTMSIYRKLAASGRADAVARAVALRIIDPNS